MAASAAARWSAARRASGSSPAVLAEDPPLEPVASGIVTIPELPEVSERFDILGIDERRRKHELFSFNLV
jgi:hypothetical protein